MGSSVALKRFRRFTPVLVTFRDAAIDDPGWQPTSETGEDVPVAAIGYLLKQGKQETILCTCFYTAEGSEEVHTNGRFRIPTGAILSVVRLLPSQ
jgi:hypothetical protein